MKYTVKVDGEVFDVEVKDLSCRGAERVYKIDVAGKEFAVSVQRQAGQHEAPPVFTIECPDLPAAPPPRENNNGAKSDDAESGVSVTAPMTGKIVSINAKPGDKVSRGDVLFVLEAMKMENSLPSTTDGTVLSINVKVGDIVKKGDVLCVVSAES